MLVVLSFSAWRCGSLSSCLREQSLSSRGDTHISIPSCLWPVSCTPMKNGHQTNNRVYPSPARVDSVLFLHLSFRVFLFLPVRTLHLFFSWCVLNMRCFQPHLWTIMNKKQLILKQEEERLSVSLLRSFLIQRRSNTDLLQLQL